MSLLNKRARLCGLVNRSDLNGAECEVIAFEEGVDKEYTIKLPQEGTPLKVRRGNLEVLNARDYRTLARITSELTDVFSSYDTDRSRAISFDEFKELIKDLILLKTGGRPLSEREVELIATTIASGFPGPPGRAEISLQEFIDGSLLIPSPFDVPSIELGSVLLGKAAMLVERRRFAAFDPDSSDEESAPFEPSYEWQRHPDEGPYPCMYGLELEHSTKSCRIADPMILKFKIPTMENRQVTLWAKRGTTLSSLLPEMSLNWPGRRGRDFSPPSSSSLSLFHNGVALDPTLTVEEARLFFIQKEVEVIIGGGAAGKAQAPPPAPPRSRHPPPPQQQQGGGGAATKAQERSDAQAAKYDTLAAQLRGAEKKFGEARDKACATLEFILDKVKEEKEALESIDRKGLQSAAKELLAKLKLVEDVGKK